ncbi:hypothetical protein P8452_30212 [Trifolium repens]|nr:hypothetical protein P8452_30212 [Trifolium repens]
MLKREMIRAEKKKETNKDEEANKDENDEENEAKKIDYDWDDFARLTLILKVQILIHVHLEAKVGKK